VKILKGEQLDKVGFSDLMLSETENLLPCPHCGGKPCGAVWMEYFLDMGAWPTVRVICADCNSMMDTKGLTKSEAIRDATEKWNRRA
jgi:Lar family restriction alleviation protein